MRFRYLATLSFAFALVTLPAPSARAQTSQNSGWGDLSISAARIDYDLSGVGSAPGFSIRTTRDLSPNVALEFGGVFAKLEQPLGTTPLFMPEAHVRYRWNLGRFSPYMSGGMGASLVTSSFHSDWDPTLSIAGGTGVRLTERLAAVGELRIRGHQFNFAGSTADISGGLVWRLSAL